MKCPERKISQCILPLRISVDIDTWRAALGLLGNVSMSSSVFYLTKCLMCILYSILLLLITLFLLFTVQFYVKDLDLMASLHVDSINIEGGFFSKFSNKCRTIPHGRMIFSSLLFFISVIFLLLSGNIATNKSRSRLRLFQQFFLLSLKRKQYRCITLLRCLYCKLTTPYIGLILLLFRNLFRQLLSY